MLKLEIGLSLTPTTLVSNPSKGATEPVCLFCLKGPIKGHTWAERQTGRHGDHPELLPRVMQHAALLPHVLGISLGSSGQPKQRMMHAFCTTLQGSTRDATSRLEESPISF